MTINSRLVKYKVELHNNFDFVSKLISKPNSFFIIDVNVFNLYKDYLMLNDIVHKLYLLEATEENKTVQAALNIIEQLTSLPQKKNLHIVAIGGGITQDVVGFVASVIYRGVEWTYLPTTLLSMVDSCIGGKTSLNYKSYKNLLGTFYPPAEIHIFTNFIETLSPVDFLSGIGEVAKFNIIQGIDAFRNFEIQSDNLINKDLLTLNKFILDSLKFKKGYIEEDEFDKGQRNLLNYGHSFGHAIETNTNYFVPHGTSVILGIMMANRVSMNRGYLTIDFVEFIENTLKKFIDNKFIPVLLNNEKFIETIRKDKKQEGEKLRLILISMNNNENIKTQMYEDIALDEIDSVIKDRSNFWSV